VAERALSANKRFSVYSSGRVTNKKDVIRMKIIFSLLIVLLLTLPAAADWKDVANQAFHEEPRTESEKVLINQKDVSIKNKSNYKVSTATETPSNEQTLLPEYSHGIRGENHLGLGREEEFLPIYGTWHRTAIYVGDTVHNDPATLTIKATTFSSAAARGTATGSIDKVTDTHITMTVLSTTAPINYPLPYTITYAYTLDEENKTLFLKTESFSESYVRK
jgi:hypothetical protein